MNTRRAIVPCLALLIWGCQPSVRCDPGQFEMGGGCYPIESEDSGPTDHEDVGSDAGDAADGGDAATSDECAGDDPYAGFGDKCAGASECGCHAPFCAMVPLEYCTKLNCDPADAAACPPKWTCLVIPAASRPSPEIKSLCFKP
jgi:hypothetical protein